MSQISPITAGTISVNTNLGKRANSAVIETEVKSLVTSLLNSNPNKPMIKHAEATASITLLENILSTAYYKHGIHQRQH